MHTLSLFDGMACGALAMQAAEIGIDSYNAYEIDKYAIKTANHNFPFIKQHGDVFGANFAQFEGVDIVCGGSPCTYWSIAQKNNRETEASGAGWELFQQYARAIKEAKPKYFIYENNKSMSDAIKDSISDTFDFEPIHINSALVSAQNRQRYYWVGMRKPNGGGYTKINIELPKDRGILLRDILESGVVDKEKAYCLKHQAGNARDYLKKHHTQVAFEPVILNRPHGFNKGGVKRDKAPTLTANGDWQHNNYLCEPVNPLASGKARCVTARCVTAGYANKGAKHIFESNYSDNPHKQQWDSIAEPVCVAQRGRYAEDGTIEQNYEARTDGKTNALTTVQKDNNIAEPIRIGDIGSTAQAHRVYSCDGKSVTISANGGGQGGKTGLYLCPSEGSTKATPIYEVRNGFINHNGQWYPIKLADGFYIIRKLTVRECARLQTVPEWYCFPVSDTQAYKMLGNGWTVEVIAHLMRYIKTIEAFSL